ncbi:MAG: PAS domain S-box protein [Proteobacteria bacterium]|nr:PAS domain S-box protein [Pseudomonadota bacterium]
MKDPSRTNQELIEEISASKQRIKELEQSESEHKRTEDALKESEERYRTVADFTYAWEYWLAPDGKYVYVSPACERISGYRVEEFHQDPKLLEKIIHPDDKHRFVIHIHDVLQDKSDVCTLEFRIITRNNEDRWIGHECRGVYGRDGEYLGQRGSNRDITDSKKAEEELKEKDKFMESIVQSSAVATFVVNAEHKVIYWNKACEDLTGIKSEDLLGASDHWKAFYDYPRPCVADVIIDNKFNEMTNLYGVYARSVLIPEGIHAEGWYPNLGGKNRYIVFDAAPIYDDNGKLIAAIETLQDITNRKQAEEQLKHERQRFSVLSENAPFGMAMIDKDGNFVYINPKFKEIFGYNLSEIPDGRTWFTKAYPNPAYRQTVIAAWVEDLKAAGPGEKRPRVFTVTCKDGTEKIVNLISVQMETGVHIMTCEDITSRKLAEEELQQTTEKLRKSLSGTIQALSSTVETRDPYTAGHQRKVSNLARVIAQEMGLSNDTVDTIRMAGIIHDIGKISVPAEILSKGGTLTNIEMNLIKVHSQSGYDILKDVGLPYPIAEIVLQHHERLDGSGYPQGLKGEQILLETKIISVADVVEAIPSHRPYRPALGIDAALEEIENNKDILYDAQVVEACLKLFREKGFCFE